MSLSKPLAPDTPLKVTSDPDRQNVQASANPPGVVARVRVLLGESVAIGPGKADVLDGIRDTGSIAAAGRRLGMGYKRVWLLVDSMNRCFSHPLVEASKGGARGGGARLTELGEEVLLRYRHMEALAEAAIAEEVAALQKSLRSYQDRK